MHFCPITYFIYSSTPIIHFSIAYFIYFVLNSIRHTSFLPCILHLFSFLPCILHVFSVLPCIRHVFSFLTLYLFIHVYTICCFIHVYTICCFIHVYAFYSRAHCMHIFHWHTSLHLFFLLVYCTLLLYFLPYFLPYFMGCCVFVYFRYSAHLHTLQTLLSHSRESILAT